MHESYESLAITAQMLRDMRVKAQPDGYHHIMVSREEMASLFSDASFQLVCRRHLGNCVACGILLIEDY